MQADLGDKGIKARIRVKEHPVGGKTAKSIWLMTGGWVEHGNCVGFGPMINSLAPKGQGLTPWCKSDLEIGVVTGAGSVGNGSIEHVDGTSDEVGECLVSSALTSVDTEM